MPNGLVSTNTNLDQTPDIASRSCEAILRNRASPRRQAATKNWFIPFHTDVYLDHGPNSERHVNMLKNNKNICGRAEPNSRFPLFNKNNVYDILVKIVYEIPPRGACLVQKSASGRIRSGNFGAKFSQALALFPETAGLYSIDKLTILRPNRIMPANEQNNPAARRLSRSRDTQPGHATLAKTPATQTDSAAIRHGLAAPRKRLTPHATSYAGLEISCVE